MFVALADRRRRESGTLLGDASDGLRQPCSESYTVHRRARSLRQARATERNHGSRAPIDGTLLLDQRGRHGRRGGTLRVGSAITCSC